MKPPFLNILLILTFTANSPVTRSEIVKWVDENGKVHYGNSAPAEYSDAAEEVILDEINTVAPEADVRQQNRLHYNKLRQQDREAELAKRRAAEAAAETNNKAADSSENQKPTREMCRDMFGPNDVAERTACFKQAAENQ